MKLTPERRQQITFWVPGVLAGLVAAYLSPDDPLASTPVRVFNWLFFAVGGGFVLTLGGTLIYLAASYAASRLLGEAEGDLRRRLVDTPALLSGIVVALFMWSWWHIDKRTDERELIACVDSRAIELGGPPSHAVRSCLDEIDEGFDDYE